MPEIKEEAVVENQINPDKIGFLAPVDDSNSTLLQIFVKTLQGKTISTEVEKDALVIAIMEQVAQKTDIPVLDQRLQFAGKQLDPALSIQEYALQKENTLHLSVRLDGGMGEYKVVQNFLKARITHGNVTGLVTKESTLAVNRFRSKSYREKYKRTRKYLKFAKGYESFALQQLCFDSMVIEGFHGGNCSEMAKWTAAQLIENTKDQWVYICYLDGSFTLKNNINPKDKKHVLYRSDKKKVSNAFDHVMVITYPEEVSSIAQMEDDKATVVDTWYDHLVCSLKDYKAKMHPYFKYKYAVEQGLALKDSDIAISQSFASVGVPFANNKKVAQRDIAHLKRQIEHDNKHKKFLPRLTKYEFGIRKRVKDNRSTENLENLLLEAKKVGEHSIEVNMFEEHVFETIIKSTNQEVLKILFETAHKISLEAFEHLCYVIECADMNVFNLFCTVVSPQTLGEFFTEHFSDYQTHPAFVSKMDTILHGNSPHKAAVLKAISTQQFDFYCLNSRIRFTRMMRVEQAKDSFIQLMNGMTDNDWATLINNGPSNQIAPLLDSLLGISRKKTAKAIEQLSQNQFHDYFRNRNNLDDFCSSGINDSALQAIFAKFRAYNIDPDTGNPNSPLSDVYAQKLGSYYWGAYEG